EAGRDPHGQREGGAGGLGRRREARPGALRDGGGDRGGGAPGAAPCVPQDWPQDDVRAPGNLTMPQVKARQLREKSVEELRTQEETLREQIFKLRFQKATGQSENPQRVSLVRKELARVLTVLREKEAGGGA